MLNAPTGHVASRDARMVPAMSDLVRLLDHRQSVQTIAARSIAQKRAIFVHLALANEIAASQNANSGTLCSDAIRLTLKLRSVENVELRCVKLR